MLEAIVCYGPDSSLSLEVSTWWGPVEECWMLMSPMMRQSFSEGEKMVDAGRQLVEFGMWQLYTLTSNRQEKRPYSIDEGNVEKIRQISVRL